MAVNNLKKLRIRKPFWKIQRGLSFCSPLERRNGLSIMIADTYRKVAWEMGSARIYEYSWEFALYGIASEMFGAMKLNEAECYNKFLSFFIASWSWQQVTLIYSQRLIFIWYFIYSGHRNIYNDLRKDTMSNGANSTHFCQLPFLTARSNQSIILIQV